MQLFARCGLSQPVVLAVPEDGTVADMRLALDQKLSNFRRKHSDFYFTFGGRQCANEHSLKDLGMHEGSSLDVQRRLRGGGGDGGATGAESRVSYLEMYMSKKPDKVDPAERRLAQWTRCQLSGENLACPVVCDELGHLFNKEAIVAALIAKSVPPSLGHISSLRHLIDLKLEHNPAFVAAQTDGIKGSGNSAGVDNVSAFSCPLTGLDLNGRFRFVVMRSSGHVISERALKEVPAAVGDLIGGDGIWQAADLLPVNGTEEEVATLREALLMSRAAEKAVKAAKKAAKQSKACCLEAVTVDSNRQIALDNISKSSNSSTEQESAVTIDVAAPSVRHGATVQVAKATVKWPKREQQGNAGNRLEAQKKFKASRHVPEGGDKSVYASIFTSSSGPLQESYAARSIGARFI